MINTTETWKNGLLIFVYTRILTDLMDELINTPAIGKYKYECRRIHEQLNREQKKLKRTLNADDFQTVENIGIDVADAVEPQMQYLRAMLTDALVNKIEYSKVKLCVLIGLSGGLIDILQLFYKSIGGKKKTSLEQCSWYLKDIDNGLSTHLLNKGVSPDFSKCNNAFQCLFNAIKNETIKTVKVYENKKQIR